MYPLARKEGFEPSRRFYPAYSLSRGAPLTSWVLPQIWRRGWDLNPQKLAPRRFSKPVPYQFGHLSKLQGLWLLLSLKWVAKNSNPLSCEASALKSDPLPVTEYRPIWRREWDSNPRRLAPRWISRPVPSTTRTSLQIWWSFGDSNPGPARYERAALTN